MKNLLKYLKKKFGGNFKFVPGYANRYVVSDTGKVVRLGYTSIKGRKYKTEQLKPSNHNKGYKKVCLSLNGRHKQHTVHRLVATIFLKNPHNKSQVNHIDGNKGNNNIENLEWCTPKENALHRCRVLNKKKPRKGRGYHKKTLPAKKPWVSQISVNSKIIYIGSFYTEKEAASAYQSYKQEIENEYF